MNKIYTVVICDNYEELRSGFEDSMKQYDDIKCVGTASSAAECVDKVRALKPDVLLLDIRMETETAGIDIIPDVCEASPDTKIIMLTSYDYEDYVFSALISGAHDYIVKSLGFDTVVEKIRSTCNNNSVLSNEIAEKFIHQSRESEKQRQSLLFLMPLIAKLSTGEFEVLKEIYRGKNYKSIAKNRFVEETTIKTIASRIIRKIGVKNKKELIDVLKHSKVFENFLD